jgi:SAM-dependent methyltransferase
MALDSAMKKEQASLVDKVAEYYAERAAVYDETAGYTDEIAEELRSPIKERYRQLLAGHDVLEIACGSGYWTQVVGEVVNSVLAIDINQRMIEQARGRCRNLPHVKFRVADAFSLEGIPGGFTAAFAIWWWSHIPKGEISAFLSALHSKLIPGALVLFTDQLRYDDPRRRVDDDGNIIEQRNLPDGRVFEVVKNFPTAAELTDALRTMADNVEYKERPQEKSWTVIYTTKR